MREIKFRAWEYAHERTQGIGWADSPMVWKMNYEPEIWGSETASEGDRVELNKALERGGDADERYELPNKSIYMQYTGLKDKNGVEIYHKDLVSNGTNVFEVVWAKRFGGWAIVDRKTVKQQHHLLVNSLKYQEVIGNIYEQGHLLEATQ